MGKVVLLVGAVLVAAGCSTSTGKADPGTVADRAPSQLISRNTAAAPACPQDGSPAARTCWQSHTGALGYATDHGRAWPQGRAQPDAQDPTTDPNLVTVCGTPTTSVRIDLSLTSTTVAGGTCRGPSLTGGSDQPTYGQIVHALVYGCVDVHVGNALLVDDYFVDQSPTCHTGGDGGPRPGHEAGATIQTGTGTRSHLRAAILLYVTVDGYGCNVVKARQNCADVLGIGGADFWATSVNVFGYAHDFEAFGDGPTTSRTDTSTNVRIVDSMAPCALCHTVLSGRPGDPYIHQEDVYLWNTSGVTLTHDYFSADAGTAADPEGSTVGTSAAVFQNANTNLTTVTDTYLDGGTGFNVEGNCPGGINSNETFDRDSLAPAKGYAAFGYPGTIDAWTPKQPGNVWGIHNHSADGTVPSVPAPAPGGC